MRTSSQLWIFGLTLCTCGTPAPPPPTQPAVLVGRVERTLVSPSGARVVRWLRRVDGASEFLVLQQNTGEEESICAPVPGVQVPASASSLRWADDDLLVLSWGAGSNVAELVAFSAACEVRLTLSASAIAVSPDGLVALGYPGIGTPLASPRQVKVYATHSGTLTHSETLPDGSGVVEVQWLAAEARLTVRRADGSILTLGIPTPGP